MLKFKTIEKLKPNAKLLELKRRRKNNSKHNFWPQLANIN